jgi:hypothetical protein
MFLNESKSKDVLLYKFRYIVFFLCYALNIGIFFIRQLKFVIETPDAMAQYHQVLTGFYHDHSPVMMAFVWKYLNYIWEGFFGMYFLQITFLYIGLLFIWKASEYFIDFKKHPYLLLLIFAMPFIPQIFLYSIAVQKDNQFTYSFLVVAGALSLYTVNNKKMPLYISAVLLVLLIYGTGVKYQARFVLPVLTIWMGCLLKRDSGYLSKLVYGIIAGIFVYVSTYAISETVVSKQGKDNAWQYVKLFDLAAISISIDQDLIPDANKTSVYTFDDIKSKFQQNAIDPYIYTKYPILRKGATYQEQEALWEVWFSAVKTHPVLYLKHRIYTFSYCLLGRSNFTYVDKLVKYYFVEGTRDYEIVSKIASVLGYIFLPQLIFFFLSAFYLYFALSNWSKTDLAKILFAFNFMALLLAFVVIFMSMAGTPRYTFFSIVMINASHVFAMGVYQVNRKNNANQELETIY